MFLQAGSPPTLLGLETVPKSLKKIKYLCVPL